MKRQRPIRSCLSCRERRLRCDKLHPACTRCISASIDCTYDTGTTITSAHDSRTILPPSQLQAEGFPLASVPGGSVPQSTGSLDRERGQVFVQHGGRSTYLGPTFWGNAITAEDHRINQDTGDYPFSRAANPFTKWFTPYENVLHWESEQAGNSRSNKLRVLRIDPSQCKFCGQKYRLGCILALLPTRETCERLCDLFFSTVFPLLPILHLRGFAEDFQTFWEERDASTGHDSEIGVLVRRKPSFVCLFFSILFAALKCASKSRLQSILGDSPDFTAGNIYVAAVVSTMLTGFPRRPSYYSLAAYLLTQNPFVMEEDFPDFPDFISTAFRVGLGMGLHRKLPETDLSNNELETRRRLWWYILHLDVMSSASSGLSPLFIDSKMANVEMISQRDQCEDNCVGDEHTVDVRYLVATRRYEVSQKMRHVLRLHFEHTLQSPEQVHEIAEQLKAVAHQVSGTIQLLLAQSRSSDSSRPVTSPGSYFDISRMEPKSFDRVWRLGNGHDQEVLNFCAWSAILLHLMVHKAFCVLYHALFRDPDMVSNPQIRTSAILHAQAFVQLFIRVCNDPVSEAFRWMYPGIYQPLQAVSLLLADLLRYPHSDEASLSRGLVDAVFDQYQVDEGLVGHSYPPERRLSPLGRDAWAMLAEARKKVLEQLGEDHHVLLPSRSPYSDICICGERFAESQQCNQPEEYPRSEPAESFLSPAHLFETTNIQGISSLPAVGHTEFDWQEWDATVGNSLGFLS